jgi:hypothetical protein
MLSRLVLPLGMVFHTVEIGSETLAAPWQLLVESDSSVMCAGSAP